MKRTADGGVELQLSRDERTLVANLASELRSLLDSDTGDPSLQRLFPPAYEEEADESAYRDLMGSELLNGRRQALDLLARTARQKRLSPEEAEAWLRALNDLRLVLGTRLDVEEDMLFDDLRPDDPRSSGLAIYGWLSWLQEQLVAVLSEGLEGGTGPSS
jgi:Domain of unknown function (DUF2017)